jgi:TATA-box binding protein (TBP) (component of TFIID and TFIIIB)
MATTSPTMYKISTITATGTINAVVDLDVLYNGVDIDNGDIVYAEYGSRKCESIYKGYAKKLRIARRSSDNQKRFDNQITLVYKYNEGDQERCVNVKVFKNGHIQMTGLKHVDQGMSVIHKVIETIEGIRSTQPLVVKESLEAIVPKEGVINMQEYKIRLINCDFRVGFEIRRDQLHRCMCRTNDVMCSFEPCIYPGCKIQYWYNSRFENDGVCRCISACHGKGSGHGDGECKKITIAVFQSGCIIITGGQSMDQVNVAYKFVCDTLSQNYEEVRKKPLRLV